MNTIARHAGKLALVLAVLIAPAMLGGNAAAQTGTYNPDTPADPATETHLKELALELRCLVCQNQTIADSNADLAVDLRRIVRSQLLEGKSDGEIKAYLVARYGDFVLYKPPVQGNTTLLWFGPFALLLAGAGVWWLLSRRRAAVVAANAMSVDEEQKAKSLLDNG
jgi:cytochrome c-type biogenesis protein CcmH